MRPNKLPRPFPAADKPDAEMEAYWGALRETDYAGSFAGTEAWVRRQRSVAATHSVLESLRSFFIGTSFRVACSVLALLFLVGACNYPIAVNEPIAAVLRWEVNAADKAAQEALKRLSWLQQSPVMVQGKNVNGLEHLAYSLTVPTADPETLQTYRNSLSGIKGVSEVTLVPITHKRSQPLYAAALQNLFKIELDATGVSNEELEKELNEQLRQQGIENLAIEVTTGADGQRLIKTRLEDMPRKDFGLDLKVKDGNRMTHIKEEIKHRADETMPSASAMSDAELKAFIIKKHPDLQLSEKDITIARKPESVDVIVQHPSGRQFRLQYK